jgi:undecaprenyl-diphosphatase
MRLRRAAALGLLHGPAELLPVSSSAHAALLLQDLDGERRKEVEVALHLGTLLALGPPPPAPWLVLATAPPALAGFLLEGPIERRLGTPRSMAAGLLAGGIALGVSDAVAERRRPPRRRRLLHAAGARGAPRAPLGTADALALGVAQAAALVPGVSRHGAALTLLRARGFEREDAHAISRDAAKPVLAGAAALKGARFAARAVRAARGGSDAGARPEEAAALATAVAASALSTWLAKRALAGRGLRAPLWPYAVYRAVLAAAIGSGTSPGAASRRPG